MEREKENKMSVTQQAPLDERVVLRNQLTKMAGEFKAALPPHITTDRFNRVVLTAVQQDPDLMLADRRSLLMAATKCAQDGLLPDKREADFVIFNTKVKDKWVKSVTYMPMIAGIQKRALNTGLVTSLQGHVIYEHDTFIWQQGTDEKLEHKPLFPGDRGEPIGAYAVARIKGEDRPLFRVMDKSRIDKARAVSKNADGAVWRMWWDEMAIKTVVRNLAKSLPADAEMAMFRAVDRDDDAPDAEETTVTIDAVLTDEQRALPSSRLDVIEGGLIEGGEDNAE
jgi:recombination protein RecT